MNQHPVFRTPANPVLVSELPLVEVKLLIRRIKILHGFKPIRPNVLAQAEMNRNADQDGHDYCNEDKKEGFHLIPIPWFFTNS
jgi:hypothetical protein